MKKFLLFCMSAAMLASCSNEEPAAPGASSVENPDEITLGVSGLNVNASVKPGTKAALDGFDLNEQFTVFGLAKNAGADWTQADDRLFDTGFATGQIIAGTNPNYQMQFVDGLGAQAHYYYPGYNGNNYSFFACYPEVAAPTIGTTQVTALYDIDGKTDIMWAGVSAAPVNTVEGYNASYFRQPGAQRPNLNFEHQLTQLVFKFQKGDGFGTEELRVRNIKINNTYNQGTLTVATDATAAAPAATFAGTGNQDAVMPVYDVNDNAIENATGIIIHGGELVEPTEVGYTMLVPATEYELEVEFYTGDDVATAVTRNVPVRRTGGDFFAGTKYNVTFTITGQIEIEIAEVSVEPWVEEEVNGGEIAM